MTTATLPNGMVSTSSNDYEDRMTSATVGGTTWTYAYRGDGLRDSATSGGVTRAFTWDVNAGLPVILDDGSQYVYGAGLVAQVSGANTYYYLADGLGSTIATTDSSGAVVNSYTYDVYGKTTASSGAQANDFQFAGQQTDPTGLQYLRARYYDPETGGFLSREPMASGPSWPANSFVFGVGNPGRFVDRSGLYPADENGCHADRQDPECARRIDAEWDRTCGGLYYYTYDHCRDSLGNANVFKDAYYGAIVTVAKPLLGEYHQRLVSCVRDDECRKNSDAFFQTLQGFGPGGVDQAARDAALASPWPWLAGVYSILRALPGTGASQVWAAYKYEYGK